MKATIAKHNKDSIIAKHVKTGTWRKKGAAPQDVVSENQLTQRVRYESGEKCQSDTIETEEKKKPQPGGYIY